jgi:hypothetical protein
MLLRIFLATPRKLLKNFEILYEFTIQAILPKSFSKQLSQKKIKPAKYHKVKSVFME